MSTADDIARDLANVLGDFSTYEQRLQEKLRGGMERGKVASITVDTWESLPFPVVRHIFYGLNEKQARSFMAAHKESDIFFRQCFKGQFKDTNCRNSLPRSRQVTRAAILADGGPPVQQKGTLGQKLKGATGKKGTGV